MKTYSAVVTSYDHVAQSGKMRVAGETEEVPFVLNKQRPFKAGFREPVFGGSMETPEVPSVGTATMAALAVYYTKETTPYRRILRRHVEVLQWGFPSSYEETLRIIAERPRYEFVEFTLYNNIPTTGNQRRVIATGTALEIQAGHPRGKSGPETTSLGFTYRRRFYLIGKDGKKTQCPDPRPVPPNMAAEEFRPTNEQGELLSTKQDLIMELVIPSAPRKLQPWVSA